MSTNEPRASDLRQRVPDAFRLAFLLFFKPLELWARMVLWEVDGDPGFAFIWRFRGMHQRDWVLRLAEIVGAAAILACLVLLVDYGWSRLLGLFAIGLLVTVVVACVAGIAFGTLLGVLVALMMMIGVWLPPMIAGVPVTVALWCFGIGFTVRNSLVISDRVFDSGWDRDTHGGSNTDEVAVDRNKALHSDQRWHRDLSPFVWVGGAFACYWGGETGLQRFVFFGLLGLGISLHPLVEWIRRMVQRRKPMVFLSYRRNDDVSRDLVGILYQRLPHGRAFLDERMQGGEWQPRILSELERATVLLTFVGPKWREEEEEEKKKEMGYMVQRRSSFWVSFELGYANRRKIPIRPVIVDRDCPKHLRAFQYTPVCAKSEAEKEEALKILIDVLKRDGMRL